MCYVYLCLTVNNVPGPDNRVHQVFPYQLTIGPEHHPDPDPEAPCKDQEATWARELLLIAPMGPSLDPALRWEVQSIHNGTTNKSGVQAFSSWAKQFLNFIFDGFQIFCLYQVKVQKYSCCDTFLFYWVEKKLKFWTKRARIHTCSKIVKRKKSRPKR